MTKEFTIEPGTTLSLNEDQINELVNLIREKGGETDIEVLELEDRLPDVYEALDEAYSDAASKACFTEWAIVGYKNGYFDDPEDLMERIVRDGLFSYDEDDDEDEVYEAFYDWLYEYFNSLDDNGKMTFLETYYLDALNGYEPEGDAEYEIEIPAEIVALAKEA